MRVLANTNENRHLDKLRLSAVAVLVVLVLCVVYLYSAVLGGPLTTRPRSVRVDLPSTGGLFEGSAVSYRGANIGTITDIGFSAHGVVATAKLTSSIPVPRDTRAVVRSLSPVGEQYLDLQPRADHGPWLVDGSEITAERTDVPATLASTVISVDRLLGQVDTRKLQTVLREAGTAFNGSSADLARLTTQGRALVHQLDARWPQLHRVLVNAGILLDIGTRNAHLIRLSAHDFAAFARYLRRYGPELDAALRDGPGQAAQLRSLVADARAVLPQFVSTGGDLMALLASYEPHLRTLLAEFSPGLGVLARAVRNGSIQLNVIGQKDHDCSYGTTIHDPSSTTRHTMNRSGHCPASFPWLQRGAAHAPGPVTPAR